MGDQEGIAFSAPQAEVERAPGGREAPRLVGCWQVCAFCQENWKNGAL